MEKGVGRATELNLVTIPGDSGLGRF